MTEMLRGFPFWVLSFERNGQPSSLSEIDHFIGGVNTETITDLFVFSHGWNNDRNAAMSLYDRFFAEVQMLLLDPRLPKRNPNARIGVAGVIWPSILWPDDAASAAMTSGTVGSNGGEAVVVTSGPPLPATHSSPKELNLELKKGYPEARQQALLNELTGLLETQPKSDAALSQFQTRLAELLDTEPPDSTTDSRNLDYVERAISTLSKQRWRELLEVLGDESLPREGGTVGLGNPFQTLWAGAREALRVVTYSQMKQRAGIVGREGLGGVVLTRIARDAPNTRVHLLGHSFGARLVSFALLGLPVTFTRETSPVKSLLLLQGALSHYAFADRLPHDARRSGPLKGMADRVDGPLLTTYSSRSLAAGLSVSVASFINHDDASAGADHSVPWEEMGTDGAQAVGAVTALLSAPGQQYMLHKGKWLNLDGNRAIVRAGLSSDPHADIASPQTAWAALTAAAIA